jgi:hypothetical protein
MTLRTAGAGGGGGGGVGGGAGGRVLLGVNCEGFNYLFNNTIGTYSDHCAVHIVTTGL